MWRINAAELDATRVKLNAINERARKRGFTGLLTLDVNEVEVKSKDDFGFDRTEVWYDVVLGGTAPKYEGWEFQAVLDWDQEAGLIVRAVPGADPVSRDGLTEGYCSHCGTNRYRKETYLVRNTETHEVRQVGSTCIKDFLGWSGTIVCLTEDDVEAGFDGFGGSDVADAVGTDYALAVSWALIKLDGYKPAKSYDSTKADTVDVLWPPRHMSPEKRAHLGRIRVLAEEAMERAKECRAFIRSEEFGGHNDYVMNLKAICAADYVTGRNIGLLVSAHQAWAKHKEATLVRQQVIQESDWIGRVGERREFTATIDSIRYIPKEQWGTTVLYVMRDQIGNRIKWFASREALGDKEGVTFTFKATVKEHVTFREIKETVVSRATVIQ